MIGSIFKIIIRRIIMRKLTPLTFNHIGILSFVITNVTAARSDMRIGMIEVFRSVRKIIINFVEI